MTIIFVPKYKLPEHKQALSLRGYIPLFKSKTLLLLMMNIIFMYVPYWIFVGMSSLLYIKDLKVSLAHFGYYQGSLALVFACGSLLFGLIIQKYSQINMLNVAKRIYFISFICIAFITFINTINPLYITLAFIPYIISQVIPSSILYPLSLNFIPEAKGKVAAILQGGRLVFASFSL